MRYLIIVLLFLTSCRSVKTVSTSKKETTKTEKTQKKQDSTNIIKKNGAINDQLVTPVSSSGNKEIDKKIDEILSKLNTQKKSGSNGYRQYYDRQTRRLVTDFIVASTKNQTITKNKEETNEKSFEEKTDEYFMKKIKQIPWWVYLGVLFVVYVKNVKEN